MVDTNISPDEFGPEIKENQTDSRSEHIEQAGQVGIEGVKHSSVELPQTDRKAKEQPPQAFYEKEEKPPAIPQEKTIVFEAPVSELEIISGLEKIKERVSRSRDDNLAENLTSLNDARNDARKAMDESVKKTAEATERMRKAREDLANRKRK